MKVGIVIARIVALYVDARHLWAEDNIYENLRFARQNIVNPKKKLKITVNRNYVHP